MGFAGGVMNMTLGPGVVIGTCLALAGCTGEAADTSGGTNAEVALSGTEWALHAFGVPSVDDGALAVGEITLVFGADTMVAGTAGCNRYFGRYGEDGPGALTLGQVGSTRMACPEPIMSQESRFLGALGEVTKFRQVGDTLFLKSDAGSELSFVRTGSTPE